MWGSGLGKGPFASECFRLCDCETRICDSSRTISTGRRAFNATMRNEAQGVMSSLEYPCWGPRRRWAQAGRAGPCKGGAPPSNVAGGRLTLARSFSDSVWISLAASNHRSVFSGSSGGQKRDAGRTRRRLQRGVCSCLSLSFRCCTRAWRALGFRHIPPASTSVFTRPLPTLSVITSSSLYL